MKDFKLFSFLILFSAGQLLLAQADDYSAGQLKSLAASALAFKDFKKAVYYYDLYLEKKPEDVRIQFQLAESYRELRDYKNALHWYQLVLKSDKNKNKLAAFHLANMHKSMGNCKEAINLFEAFKKDYRGEKEDRKYIRLAKNGILGCQHSDKSTDDNLVLERLNSSINGSHMEASPVFLSEDLLLFNSLKLELSLIHI